MTDRRELKGVHEEAVLRQFKLYLKARGVNMKILERPEPPDAIVEIDKNRTWIEITDAFLDTKHAIGITSAACENADQIPDKQRFIIDPDAIFSSVLYSVIEAKYDKNTMHTMQAQNGQGILLVGIFTPFTAAEAAAKNEAIEIGKLVFRKPVKVFSEIYAYDGTGHREFHVLYRET